jgi:hypothetical protein
MAQELLPQPATVLIKRCEEVEVYIKARTIKGASLPAWRWPPSIALPLSMHYVFSLPAFMSLTLANSVH